MDDREQRKREPTSVGWETGTYKREDEGKEWKLRFFVYGLGLLFLCSLVCAAAGAYYYI